MWIPLVPGPRQERVAEVSSPVGHAVAHQALWQDGTELADGHRKLRFAFVKNVPEAATPSASEVLAPRGRCPF